ncbi:MAG: 2-phospho-L-lactate guanylyltransferase [Microbacterium sp.]
MWSIVIPVKSASVGKSRLAVPGVDRVALARAIALDTIAATLATGHRVVVVTATTEIPHLTEAFGQAPPSCRFVADPGQGLNPAIQAALDVCNGPRAVLLGDLPALRPSDLDAALRTAENADLGMVADAEGTGTTLLTSRGGILTPRFGPASAAKHHAAGHTDLDAPLSVQTDLDTAAHLAAARALGLGPRTAALLSP